MLRSILKKLGLAKSEASGAPDAVAMDAAPAPAPASDAPDATPVPVIDARHDLVAVRAELTAALHARYHELLDHLPAALENTDAPALVRSLLEEGESAIRQPPLAAQKALAAARAPDVTVNDLVALVSNDPGLAQGLLRYANSALCARGDQPCVSLGSAIERVGTRGVENVLLSSMVGGMLCRPGTSYDDLVRLVWTHMVRCAPLAHALAPRFGVDPEHAYALGLLHDSGKLVLFERVSRFRQSWRRELNLPRHFLLWTLKRLHEPMGGLAALQWGLGPRAAWSIAHHHRDPVPEVADPAGEVIFLAERFDLARARGVVLDAEQVWAQGGLSGVPALPDDLDRLDPAA